MGRAAVVCVLSLCCACEAGELSGDTGVGQASSPWDAASAPDASGPDAALTVSVSGWAREVMPDNDIAPAFQDYAGPLVGGLPTIGRLSDLPVLRKV